MLETIDTFHGALADFITALRRVEGRVNKDGVVVGTEDELAGGRTELDKMDEVRACVGEVARRELTSPPK